MALARSGLFMGTERCNRPSKVTRPYGTNSSDDAESDEDKEQRTEWLAHLRHTDGIGLAPDQRFPSHWYKVTFSRSSGAGGQNVNKVNTKADLRFDLTAASQRFGQAPDAVLPPMPPGAVRYLVRHSPYYVASSHEIKLSSVETRSQADNVRDALDRLRRHFVDYLARDVRGETSEEQRKRVQRLVALDKGRTKVRKEKRKTVKSGRRVSRSDMGF